MSVETKIAKLVTFKDVVEAFADDADCFGFYDWFCTDKALKGKSKKLFSNLKSIVKQNSRGKKFDPENTYVFFKNNCPCYGDYKNYDDIRICDIKTGHVLFNITPKDPYGKTMLYFEGHGFETGTDGIEFKNMRELAKWFAE